jgi:hypothetical protein
MKGRGHTIPRKSRPLAPASRPPNIKHDPYKFIVDAPPNDMD